MDIFLLTTIFTTLIGATFLYLKWAASYWKRRGVVCFDKNVTDMRCIVNDAYTYFRSKGLKFGGLSTIYRSLFMAIDLDLIKLILVKNFDNFVNHGLYHNEKADPLSVNLFTVEDDKWRNLRSKLSPSFTPGKMKMMFQIMINSTIALVEVLKQESQLGAVDIKDVFARYTTDVIGSAAFGIDCNSLKDPNCEFRQYGKRVTSRSWRRKVVSIVPNSILRLINFSLTDKYRKIFIMKLVTNIIEHREKNNVYRQDLMHLLLQLKNRGVIGDDDQIMDDNKKKEYFTVNQVAAQCEAFFVAGFETSSGLMTFALLELAQHQDLQDKLREEIQKVLKKHDGMTYEAIMEMSYLDQVVSETLRFHPSGYATNRICNKDFKIPNSDVVIEKGTNVLIPIFGIQHDPEYYPKPGKFNPDRFSAEEKASRHPLAYLPFGEGPRMCIGSRFGLLQSKAGLASVINNFQVTLNSQTQVPVKYTISGLSLGVEGDVWLNLHPLESQN